MFGGQIKKIDLIHPINSEFLTDEVLLCEKHMGEGSPEHDSLYNEIFLIICSADSEVKDEVAAFMRYKRDENYS